MNIINTIKNIFTPENTGSVVQKSMTAGMTPAERATFYRNRTKANRVAAKKALDEAMADSDRTPRQTPCEKSRMKRQRMLARNPHYYTDRYQRSKSDPYGPNCKHSEAHAKKLERARDKYHEDPAHRRKAKTATKKWFKQARQDPEWAAKNREYHRAYYAKNRKSAKPYSPRVGC